MKAGEVAAVLRTELAALEARITRLEQQRQALWAVLTYVASQPETAEADPGEPAARMAVLEALARDMRPILQAVMDTKVPELSGYAAALFARSETVLGDAEGRQ